MAESGLLGMVLGGVAYLASFENMIKLEAALDLKADAVRRLGALGVWVEEDAERLGERLRLSNAESERLLALEPGGGLRRRRMRRARAHCFISSARRPSSIACWSPGARSAAGAADAAWHELATLPLRWTAPVFPLKAADFMRLGLAAGPAARRRLARRRGGLDRRRFPGRSRRARGYCQRRCRARADALTAGRATRARIAEATI